VPVGRADGRFDQLQRFDLKGNVVGSGTMRRSLGSGPSTSPSMTAAPSTPWAGAHRA